MDRDVPYTRRIIIIASAAAGMIGYIYLTPPASQLNILEFLQIGRTLDSALKEYIQRFAAALVMLGALPIATARFCGFKLRAIGFQFPRCRLPWMWFAAAIAGGFAIGLTGVFSSSLAEYYPYDAGLAERVTANGIWPFIVHSLAYFLCYYLPWELMFRGVLIFPLLEQSIEKTAVSGKNLFFASFQVIPSALLHFGHPATETVGAVFFGFAAAWIVLKTRSIFPVLLIHAAAGISLDLFMVLGLG